MDIFSLTYSRPGSFWWDDEFQSYLSVVADDDGPASGQQDCCFLRCVWGMIYVDSRCRHVCGLHRIITIAYADTCSGTGRVHIAKVVTFAQIFSSSRHEETTGT